MKKKTDRSREPSAASLKDVPPVNFALFQPGRPNPFAARMKVEGVEVGHEGPSRASLREIPELAPKTKGRANPYAQRLQAEGYELQIGRRRPAAGTEVGPTWSSRCACRPRSGPAWKSEPRTRGSPFTR